MKLVIAEKPSVAISIAKVLGAKKKGEGFYEGNGYIVSWCLGHLVQLASPEAYSSGFKIWRLENLPILPRQFKYETEAKTRKQFSVLKKLLNSQEVDQVINACDAGREGELIFRLVYQEAGCKKQVLRLWMNSMEDRAIADGFANLKDGNDYLSLFDAATARSLADWLVGINLSRLYSCLYRENFSVVRLQTPVLKLIAERDAQISALQKEPYYTVEVNLGNFVLSSERIDDLEEARGLCENLPDTLTLDEVLQKENVSRPEKPYDLTSLQREANRYFGFRAQETLELLQKLYEKKWVTYPRTDSRYLTDDMKATARRLLEKLEPSFQSQSENFQSLFNSAKVSDHYAILPTELSAGKNLEELTEDERKIYLLVRNKFLAACSENLTERQTRLSAHVNGKRFSVQGKVLLQEGFSRYFKGLGKERKETVLPPASEGQSFQVQAKQVTEKFTKPPLPYTEESLLKAMEHAGCEELEPGLEVERKGLGTPATRAGIIESLVFRKFIYREKKNLHATEKGKRLIAVVEDTFRSPQITADWEKKLALISQRKLSKDVFLGEITETLRTLSQKKKQSPLILPSSKKEERG